MRHTHSWDKNSRKNEKKAQRVRDANDCKGQKGKGNPKGEWGHRAHSPVSLSVQQPPAPVLQFQPRRSLINLIFNKPCDDAQGNAKTGNIQLSVKLITCQGGALLSLVGCKNAEISIAITITITITSISTNTSPKQRNDSHSTNVCINFDFK